MISTTLTKAQQYRYYSIPVDMKHVIYKLILTSCILLTACTSHSRVTYKVYSDPQGARITINGESIGVTPTTATLDCVNMKWVGLRQSPNGWANQHGKYEFEAHPADGVSGKSQVQSVDPCHWKGRRTPEIRFELGQNETPAAKKSAATPSKTNDSNSAIK